jgi:hypothetical protein
MGFPAGSTTRAATLALSLAMAACSAAGETASDAPVALTIVNKGSSPIHCMINFGHWVTQDLGLIGKDGSTTVQFHRQAADGALYIPRADGQRLMMIENILCSAPDDSAASRGQVPLLPIQAGSSQRYVSACRAGEPVQCETPRSD